jgi:hypothetical protein
MNSFDSTTADALQALEVQPPTGYTWFGEPDDDPYAYNMSESEAASYLVDRLTMRLYSDFYVHGSARLTSAPQPLNRNLQATGAFLIRLRQANSTSTSRQSGWTVVEIDDGTDAVIVTRDRLSLWLTADDVLSPLPPWAPGTSVTLRFPPELLKLSPGFYSVLGEQEMPLSDDVPITRVYWNLHPDGAAPFIAAVTKGFNEHGIPFRAKVCNQPEFFERTDAGVLYLPSDRWGQVTEVLRGVQHTLQTHLSEEIPAYTKRLATGVAVAEDTGSGTSFGTNRCSLLAAVALRAATAGAVTIQDKLTLARDHFASHGVNPEAPHLGPWRHEDCYEPWDVS